MEEIYDVHCHLGCGECKYFQCDAERREDTTCKRIDHKHIQFSVPWFKSYDCGQYSGITCVDFEPKPLSKWLYEHWVSMQDYMDSYKRVEGREYVNGYIGLCLDGNQEIIYYVKFSDFFYNTFLDSDGQLKWEFRKYYKKSRKSPIGYTLVTERREDVETD